MDSKFKQIEIQADHNMHEINRKYPGYLNRMFESGCRILKSDMSQIKKLLHVRRIVDDFGYKIKKNIACKRGCSQCCRMATVIYPIEAERIASITKREMQKPKLFISLGNDISEDDLRKKYSNVPCTFLENNECSIYDERPIVCRMHHNLGFTNEMCDMSKAPETTRVPKIDSMLFNLALMRTFYDENYGMSDIREYFK